AVGIISYNESTATNANMAYRLRAVATVTALLPLMAAAAGALDPSFGTAGRAFFTDPTPAAGAGEVGSGIAVAASGKLLVLSETSDVTPARVTVSRHNSDGTLDTTFGSGGRVVLDFGACGTCAVTSPTFVLKGDGTMIVGATEAVSTIAITNQVRNMVVTRLTAAGAVDTTFGVGGVARVNPEGASILHSL